jgi:ABC-type transport system substrate-binding protein
MSQNDDKHSITVNGIRLSRRDFIGLVSGTVALAALGRPGQLLAQAVASGGILKIAAPANPSSLDPATGGSGADHVFLYPIFDTLVEWDYDTLAPKPGLAKSWAYPDPQTLVLTLQEGVRFHDGTPLDAEAVKFNLDRNRSDQRSNIRTELITVDSVDVTGPLEVTLKLKEPDTSLVLILSDRAGMMVSPTAVQKLGENHDRNPVGTGFVKFTSWSDGERVELTKNTDYWKKDRPLVDGISFSIIPDSATRLRAVQSGQANATFHLDGRQLPIIQRTKSLQTVTGPTIYCYQLYLNMSRGPLQDVRVRQALNFAIDREALVRATLSGAGEPAYMNLPRSHWAFDEEVAKLYPYDPDRARALLKEAGYPNGVELDMRGYSDQGSVQRQEFIQEQLSQVGFRGRFRTGTIPDMSAAYFGAEKGGDFLSSAFTGRPDPSQTYALMYDEGAYFNAGRVPPPEGFKEALLRSRSTSDIDERRQALSQVQRLVMEQALVVPLAFRNEIAVGDRKVQNLSSSLLGKPKFEDVSLKA